MLWAQWSRFAIVSSSDSLFVLMASQLASRSMQAEVRMKAPMVLSFRSINQSSPVDPSLLDGIATTGLRVVCVMASGPDVLRVALAANARGMLVQGWAWLGLDTVAGAEMSALGNLESIEAAKAALHAWIYFEPDNTAPVAFFDRVRAATRADFPQSDDPQAAELDALSTPFAANMYDAVVLYAMAIGRNSSGPLNGRHLVQTMRNVSFDGMTGRVEIDENGDMKESIRAMNYLLESDGAMHGRQIGVCAPSGRYSPLESHTVVWPGGSGATPMDSAEPPGGVAPPGGFNTAWVLVGAGAAAAMLVGGLAFLVRRRHAHLQAILSMLFTEVSELVATFCLDVADLVTDGVACFRLVNGDLPLPNEGYRMAYAAIFCFGVAGTVLSVGYRFRSAQLVRDQLQAQARKLGHTTTLGEARRAEQLFEWELLQLHRTKVAAALSLVTAGLQGVLRARASARLEACVLLERERWVPAQVCL
jgi:hypothetical protein